MYKISGILIFSILFVLSCFDGPLQTQQRSDEVPARASQADSLESLVRVKMGDKCGSINQRGEKTKTFDFPQAQFGLRLSYAFSDADSNKYFSQGLSPVAIGTEWEYINQEGEMIIQSIDLYGLYPGLS